MMKFNVLDTESAYRRLLDMPDVTARESLFCAEMGTPFTGLMQRFGGSDLLSFFAQYGISPHLFEGDDNRWALDTFDLLVEYDAWDKAAEALDDSARAFASVMDRIPLDVVQFGLFLADMRHIPLAARLQRLWGDPWLCHGDLWRGERLQPAAPESDGGA